MSIVVSNLPPDPVVGEGHTFHPSLSDQVAYGLYDEVGRVTQTGHMGLGVIQAIRVQGVRVLQGFFDARIHWIDSSGDAPTREDRPVLEGLPESLQAGVYEEIVLPGLPACTITFTGPVAGSQEHPGGDAEVGFAVPGTYTITAEPFPYQPITIAVTVTEEPEP